MKIIAAIEADFAEGALGTRSRLDEDLLGETVLRRTLKRVLAAKRVTGVHLVASAARESEARQAADGLEVTVETHGAGRVPWRGTIASARKWSLDGWRGGLAGATVFDESMHPWVLSALAGRENADGIVSVPPAAVLLDPVLLDRMIEHYEKVRDDVRMTFTQSAPGLSAVVYLPSLLDDLAAKQQPIGRVMAYQPAQPQRDMMMLPCYYGVEADVVHAAGRCIADTQRSVDRVTAILREAGNGDSHLQDADVVSRWLTEHQWDSAGSLPAEVEIELTTEDPLADSTLRPRGPAVEPRGPIDPGLFDRLIEELATRDDVRVVLGGFGDPLQHPDWPRLVQRCRDAGLFGIAVRSPAVTLDESAVRALIAARVDVLEVLLDAMTPETYRRVHNADHFDRVVANVDRVQEGLREAGQPQPLVVCEMIKTHETMDEMEQFYDHWIGKTGSVVIVGPSTYSGHWPDLAVMQMAPPTRFPCARAFNRAMVLADGRVTVCDQDFRGEHAIGSLTGGALSELWTGSSMSAVRQSHLQGTYDATPLCAACEEWHRP